MGAKEDEELIQLEVERQKLELEFQKVNNPLQSKLTKIDTALRVIDVLSKGYVANKSFKDKATDLAAEVLARELKDF